ncbi:copper amine oxidase N-terminal domain-containing protein [Paenibacillus pasadenensis]|uniref:Copper amine oxidase-like N-terminal domain-containing protein n=1 Tax=Paenibacillus pasadenensis TaxID=217090 RepID=A0A2N5N917_9BACL|nr:MULTISPECIES: copper amine oxidase N-terminal domain-containing protein [Paenibacillus]PLT46847.1 hypothetical protein B8V81_1071 [Paenibacillus pasadenensis]
MSTYRSKKAAGLLLAGILIAGAAAPAAEAAKEAPKVLVNGVNYALDKEPLVKDGRTLVPLRGIFEALGATVDWNQYEQTITATRGKNEIFLQVNKTKAKVNDMEIELSVPAQNMSGTTMVPLRFIAEALGTYCVYYADQNLITITDRVES